FISDHKASKLVASSINYSPNVQIKHKPDGKTAEIELIPIDELVDVRGWKAIGSKLNYPKLTDAKFIDTETIMPESEVENTSSETDVVEEDETTEQDVAEITSMETVDVEVIPTGQKIVLEEDEVQEAIKPTSVTEVPLEIKNYSEENISKDTNKGEQLGLF
ncbi:MAG: topoisomerase 4 subunit, partial [Bacteroidota bacterium]